MLNPMEEKVYQIVTYKGPILPIEVAKILGIETYLASAILSTLVNKNLVKLSFRKVGSSPLYYVKGQENKVREILFKELNELEKKTLERLKELKVAFKEDLYPQERFLLNDLKDFVSYLQIKKDDMEVFCWKHYSVGDNEFKEIIERKLFKKEPEKQIQETKSQAEIPIKKEVKRKTKKISIKEFENKVLEKVKTFAEIIDKKTTKGSVRILAYVETPIGKQKVVIIAKNKRNLNENDISKIFVEEQKNKIPIVILIEKEPSIKLRKYIQENMGELVKLLKI
ncbi:MAG: hypothetical protein J7K22_02345 [Nanoarchaeota archaeon]|nr:hypothetical protein [Nanoarchaeota archaeon]